MKVIIPAKAMSKIAKIANARIPSIYYPSFVVDERINARITRPINIVNPMKKIQKVNFPEIIWPKTTRQRIYSADLKRVLESRFFSLSLNFIL